MGMILDLPHYLGFLIAILDSVGGLIGTFIASFLVDACYHVLDRDDFDARDLKRMHYKDRVLPESKLVAWKAAAKAFNYIADFEYIGPETKENESANWLITLVLLFIVAVLSAIHIVFGVILFCGIFKRNDLLIKGWLAFKCIAVTLTFLTFLALCWHFTIVLIFVFAVFAIVNGLFIAFVILHLKKGTFSQNGPRNKEALQTFKLEDVSAPGGILERCVIFIEENGLMTKGLYRVPGNKAEVDKLFSNLAKNPDTDIQSLNLAVDIVATALKELVAKRISPIIIPMDVLPEVERIAVFADAAARVQELKQFVSRLPPQNLTALKIVVLHLTTVAAQAEVNAMNSKNLAICWWPTLFHFVFTDMMKFSELEPHLKNVMQTMIDQYADIFC